MKIIDSDNYAAHDIETLFFPGGEPHCKIPEIRGNLLLYLKLRTWNDVGIAACVIDALSWGRKQNEITKIFIPYFPGARQDKKDPKGQYPYTVSMMARFLRAYGNSEKLFVFDPHSMKVMSERPGTLGVTALMPSDLSVPLAEDVVGIIAPDEGARGRAKEFLDCFYPEADLIQCYKQRDTYTGEVTHFTMVALKRKGRYIIVDDICDGGRTFNLLADAFFKDKLTMDNRCILELFVSHGIFSKGLHALDARIEHITTTDSWCPHASGGRLTVLSLNTLFPIIRRL